MRKTNKLLAAALAILLAFSTMSLSLTAFAQGDSLADRIAAYSGNLSDEAGVALAADYKSASDAEKDAVGVENVLKMYQLARARVQATGGWFPNYPVNIPKLIGNPTEMQQKAAALYQQIMGIIEVEGLKLNSSTDFTQAAAKAALETLNVSYETAEEIVRGYLGILDQKGEYWGANQNFVALNQLGVLNLTADLQQNPFRAQNTGETQEQYEAAKAADAAGRYWNTLSAMPFDKEQKHALSIAQDVISAYLRFSQGEGGIDAVKTSLSAYDDLNALQQKLLADLSYPVAVLNGEAHPFSKALQLIRGEAMQTQSPGIKPVEKPHITGSIDYPAGITKQQAQQALSASDAFLNEALEMLVPAIQEAGGLQPFAKNQLATNAMTGQALAAVYTQLDSLINSVISDLPEFVQTIVKQLIGNALIPAGAAERLTEEKYAQTKAALSADGLTWQNADLSKVNWGFSDGDMEGFIDALIAGLRPVTELVFGMQLLSLVGADIAFENKTDDDGNFQYGLYEKLFIPIYDALGITNALTSAEYTAQVKQKTEEAGNYDAYLKLVFSPLLPFIDRLLEKPIDTLTERLPHLVYESGVVFDAVREATQSIGFGLEDLVAPYLSLDGIFRLAADALQNLEINGQSVSLTLPEPDWDTIASLGSLEAVPTAGAGYAQKYAVKADQPAMFVTLLRYVEQALSQNRDEIERLIGTIEGGEELLPIIQEILGSLSQKDALTTLVIELLAPQEQEPSDPDQEENPDEENGFFPDEEETNAGDPSIDDTNETENPSTGGTAFPAALVAVAAGAGVILILSRKKLSKK